MISIGILNSMPDAAIRSTERNFRDVLLPPTIPPDVIQLRWFSLYPRKGYESVGDLLACRHLDGLILTGTEPKAASLLQEPYWPTLTRTIDWAMSHTTSTFYSCLAAHVCVLYLDGIERQPYPSKLSGIFESQSLEPQHPLVAEMTPIWQFPHSRHNGLPLSSLQAADYHVLGLSAKAGADLFEKICHKSQFVFAQSHPEYGARDPMREYRRDVLRFLSGERDRYPEIPDSYFDDHTIRGLGVLRDWALRDRTPDVMVEMQLLIGQANLSGPWKPMAMQFYSNWLQTLGVKVTQPLQVAL